MQNLATAIMRVDGEWSRALDFQDALIKLSQNEFATEALAWQLRDSAVECENLWRDIELRDDFKAKYGTDRDKALEDFHNGILK